MMEDMPGFKKSQIRRKLKELGLKKGLLTENQKALLRQLFDEYKGNRQMMKLITGGMGGRYGADLLLGLRISC
jgi:hypothetical protein